MSDGEKKIIDRIISDAERAAASSVRVAEETAKELLETAEKECAERREEVLSDARRSAEELVRHRLTLAELEIKKDALSERQAVVDKAFAAAKAAVLNMPELRYKDLIKDMLRKHAANGDTVVVGKADSKRITAAFIESTAKDLKLKLGYDGNGEFEGGVKLTSAACDKNLTFDSLFKMLRQETETEVARRLFEDRT